MRLLERRLLQAGDLPGDFFRSAPAGVRLVDWDTPIRPGEIQHGRFWVVSSDPPVELDPSQALSGAVTFELEVGYELFSPPRAMLDLNLIQIQPGSLPEDALHKGNLKHVASVPISGPEGTVRVTFSIDTQEYSPGIWRLWPELRVATGASSFAVDFLYDPGRKMSADYGYCMRCEAAPER